MNYIKTSKSPETIRALEIEDEAKRAVDTAIKQHQAEIAEINKERDQKLNERQRVWQEYKNQTEGTNYTDVR